MPILSKGQTFATGNQVTADNLNALVDGATFATPVVGDSGATDNLSLEVSSGKLRVKDGGVTVSKLSTGRPAWDASGNLAVTGSQTIAGTLATGGAITSSNAITANGNLTTNSKMLVTDSHGIFPIGTEGRAFRTVGLSTAALDNSGVPVAGGNKLSFNFEELSGVNYLNVFVDGVQFRINLGTPIA